MDGRAIMIVADQLTVFDAAIRYLNAGISVIPCNGKVASVDWNIFTQRRASRAIVEAWERYGVLNNVAVMCGQVSNNLVVLDLDGDDAVNAFRNRFGGDDIADTWTVRSGSGHGLHVYWRVGHLPRTMRALGLVIGNIELRANGCYVVAPPSEHPMTHDLYSVHHRAPIRRLEHVEPVREWMQEWISGKQRAASAAHPAVTAPVKHISRWAHVALAAECAAVRRATAGRNNALNRAAFKLGQLVGSGKLDRVTAERALEDAAAHLSASDGERATLATIKSGIDAGMEKPR